MQKILITGLEYNKAAEIFRSAGDFECLEAPGGEEELAEMVRVSGAKYVIAGTAKYSGPLYDALPAGGVIARFGVGYDGIDRTRAKARGIYCTNTPGALDDSVAECAIGMILLAARNFVVCASDNKNGLWKNRVGLELAGKTLAIIGCGGIGSKVARIAKAGFGMRTVGFARTHRQSEFLDAFTGDWLDAVKDADFVSIHLPNTPETRGFVNAQRLSMMKNSAWLINTARGAVIDEDALYDAVKENRIAGAVLDVFQNEPYAPNSKDLRTVENIIMTPHIGSSTHEACARMALSTLANIRYCENGQLDKMNLI